MGIIIDECSPPMTSQRESWNRHKVAWSASLKSRPRRSVASVFIYTRSTVKESARVYLSLSSPLIGEVSVNIDLTSDNSERHTPLVDIS